MSNIDHYVIGAIIRIVLATSQYQKTIANHVAISTPGNSWKRIIEAVHLETHNLYPYDSDRLHENPLHLSLYSNLINLLGDYIFLIFIACDLAIAYVLTSFANKYCMLSQEKGTKNDHYQNVSTKTDLILIPQYVLALYLFNPYAILNCVGLTTTVFLNLFMALFLYGMIYKSSLLCAVFLSACITQNFYVFLLLSPLFLQFWNEHEAGKKPLISVTLVLVFWFFLVLTSYCYYNNFDFMNNTYGFLLEVPELRPNIGLFWYFFTEIFENFRILFLCVFQLNICLLYIVPLSLRFHKDPMLLTICLLLLITIFKPYPCLGDVAFVLALLPCCKHLFKYTQQTFLVGCSFCLTTALAPMVWYLWIYAGSANANFYFGVTLAFGTTQIVLLTDLLFAYVKREFDLCHGNIHVQNLKLC